MVYFVLGFNLFLLRTELCIRIRSDPKLFSQVGSGIVVPDPDMTFFDKKIYKVLQIFLLNWPFRLWFHRYIFPYKILKFFRKSCRAAAVPLSTLKICQLFGWPDLKVRILIWKDVKSRIRIRTKSFRIHITCHDGLRWPYQYYRKGKTLKLNIYSWNVGILYWTCYMCVKF